MRARDEEYCGAYSTNPDLGSPVLMGKGWAALTARPSEGGGGSGTNRDKRTATQAATQATTVACTWRRARFPRIILRRRLGSSSSPMLAAVPSLAERFISRLPLRFMITGTMTMSSPMVRMAFQRCRVWVRVDARCVVYSPTRGPRARR